jgi:hypothetical protein
MKMSHVISIIQNIKICLMGIEVIIELNIWERAKVGIHFNYFVDVNYVNYTNYLYCRYAILCTVWWGAEASMAVSMPLITVRSSTGTLVLWVHILSFLCCQTNLLGFCLSFTLVDLKLWIYLYYPTTGASSMCMAHLTTIR